MEALPLSPANTQSTSLAPAERLESGEILVFADCPFPLPTPEERQFLFRQRVLSRFHKNITYNPANGRVAGFDRQPAQAVQLLQSTLARFSRCACCWLAEFLPQYAAAWRPDRASYRPEEEALRKLRPTARNDLLHLDAFPTRPSHGDRLLRLYVNLHASEPRVWATSDPFATLLERFGPHVGLPPAASSWPRRLVQLFRPDADGRSYDQFMLKLHHFLKRNDDFQERSAKKLWHFPSGSAWLLFTDGLSYAELRGQHALEHSFFVPARALTLPERAPAALLDKACGRAVTRAA